MKRLPHETEEALLAIMRKAAGPQFDEQQARYDFAGILEQLPRLIEQERQRPNPGPRRGALRILAEIASEAYFHHTGKGPSNTVYNGQNSQLRGRSGGKFVRFVEVLAMTAELKFDPKNIPGTCKEARRALSKRAGLTREPNFSPSYHGTERNAARGKLLDTHAIGRDDEGDESIMAGYEPAPTLGVTAGEVFADFLKKRRD